MTRTPMKCGPLRPAALIATLVLASSLMAPASAQDPAYIGGNGDPALVGGSSRPAAGPRAGSAGVSDDFSQARMSRGESIEDAETLLAQLRSQIGGTADDTPPTNEPLGTDRRGRDLNNALRYRNEVDAMVRKHWDQLSPITRDLYSANYDRSNPYDNSRRYRSPYGDQGQPEDKLLGATRDVQGAMQNLEDLLLPLLKDLKQGFDDGLQQQRAIQR